MEQTHLEELVASGLAAIDRRDWPAAFERLSSADASGRLGPTELEALARAAYWTGRPVVAIDARERAYAGHLRAGDRARAAFVALTLRRDYHGRLQESVAHGWLSRAEELLAEAETPSVAHGYLAIARAEAALGRGDIEAALAGIDRAIELSRDFDDPDLRAWARMRRGMYLVEAGRADEGVPLMDEVAASAVGGELGQYTTGAVFCNVISTSRDRADYRRAGEWSDAAKRWCERQSISGFPGICRVRRAEILRLVGSWGEAEQEIRVACDELAEFNRLFAAEAHHELGEVRLRVGDLDGAEAAFTRAHELGEDPQPGRALAILARGDPDGAAASIARSIADKPTAGLARARLLPAAAVIARARGDLDGARAAADELAAIADLHRSPAMAAGAAAAAASAAFMAGDPTAAIADARRAMRSWREVDAPYEAATVGVLLAEAYALEGDAGAARAELEAAAATFRRLGAEPDLRRAETLLAGLAGTAAGRGRVGRVFMFTDIVGSTALLEAVGDEAWSDLRRWHDDVVRGCFNRHGGEEIDHAGDGFFVAFRDAESATACATEIQRTMADHRRDHGFAPQLRIGLHGSDALRAGTGYSGRGVHLAARIAAAASPGEILASHETVDGLIEPSERRDVALKGIGSPVRVVSVPW